MAAGCVETGSQRRGQHDVRQPRRQLRLLLPQRTSVPVGGEEDVLFDVSREGLSADTLQRLSEFDRNGDVSLNGFIENKLRYLEILHVFKLLLTHHYNRHFTLLTWFLINFLDMVISSILNGANEKQKEKERKKERSM